MSSARVQREMMGIGTAVRRRPLDRRHHGQVRAIARMPASVMAYIHGPTGFSSMIAAMFAQWFSSRLRLAAVDWLVVP